MGVNLRPKSARRTLCLIITHIAAVPDESNLLMNYQVRRIDI